MAEKSGADVTNPGDVMGMIKQYDFLSISLGGKIHCSLTNRDLPLRVDAIQQHVNSKKLKREREWYNADFSKYEPLIVAHKSNPKMLFCTLTGIELNRIPKQIEAHVNGKRFSIRKAEVEDLKQAQRQPAPEDTDTEADEFWEASDGRGAEEGSDEDADMNDVDEEEEEEEQEEEAAASRPQQTEKANGDRKGAKKGKHKKDKGKGTGGDTKAARADRGVGGEESGASGGQGNGVSGGGKRNGKKGKKGGKQKEAEKRSPKPEVNKDKAGPLSDDTPAVSNTVKAAPVPPPDSKKARGKSKSSKGKSPSKYSVKEERKAGNGAAKAEATSATKRKNTASDDKPPSGKKKRKA